MTDPSHYWYLFKQRHCTRNEVSLFLLLHLNGLWWKCVKKIPYSNFAAGLAKCWERKGINAWSKGLMIHNPLNCLLFKSLACLTGCLNAVLRVCGKRRTKWWNQLRYGLCSLRWSRCRGTSIAALRRYYLYSSSMVKRWSTIRGQGRGT